MDITTQLDSVIAENEREAVITIFQQNGDPYLAADGTTACTVTLVGKESKRVKAALDANMRRLLRGKKTKRDETDVHEDRLRVAAAACVSWSGWEAGGAPAELNEHNLKLVLRADHILEQFEQGIDGHADFFTKS